MQAEAPASANTNPQILIGLCATLHLLTAKAEAGESASNLRICFNLREILLSL
jgi:hypothetical protein